MEWCRARLTLGISEPGAVRFGRAACEGVPPSDTCRDPELRHSAAQGSPDDLLDLAGRGDQQAFARLYDRVAGSLYGLVLRVVRDPGQAEEVAQDALPEI
ncbi:hypothetical protein ACFXJ8_08460 [Nonomuraea sp. NPDC059194]|uniref:hypothetical protein n=1 Tax=Nonomuraea sp. NPDC059194 TaxID=3346764 RepID=UPI0036951D37